MEKLYAREAFLTTVEQLQQKLRSPTLCIIDVRPAEDYAAGHIPRAIHFDLFGLSLIDTAEAPLRAFMHMIHHLFELRGVSEDKEVVFYEETSGMRAARGLWFMDYFGHPSARLLDGGIRAWRQAGHPITTEATAPTPAVFKTAVRRDVLATAADVRGALGQSGVAILDTRSDGEYYGSQVRAARGGAIPSATHIEWTENLDASGKFKQEDDLASMYARAGITPDKEVITYCQGGYRAAHSYVALKLIGFSKVRNYIGSWKEWGDRTDVPIEHPRRE